MDPVVPLTYDYSSMAPDYSGIASPNQSSIILTVFFQVFDNGTSEQIIHIPVRLNFPMNVRPLPDRTLLQLLPPAQDENDDSTDATFSLSSPKEDKVTPITSQSDIVLIPTKTKRKQNKKNPADKKFICKLCTPLLKKYTTCYYLHKHLKTAHKIKQSECLQYIKINYPEATILPISKSKVCKKRAAISAVSKSKRILTSN